MNTVIYGAQGIALGTYNAIREIYPNRKIVCFLVTSLAGNAPILADIPVRELGEFTYGMTQDEKDNIEVIVATPETVMRDIEHSLIGEGLYNIKKIDSVCWAKLQEIYFKKIRRFTPLTEYPIGTGMTNIRVFKMVHHKDRDLETVCVDKDYVTRLQVGSRLADKTVAELKDDIADNISDKNGNYSELTGLYWIWRNYINNKVSETGYVGLAHYRRYLDISDDDLKRLSSYDIDVVLPYPMPYEPNIEVHHQRYLDDVEWSSVLQALNELQPEYAKAFADILKQGYLYNYNVILAKYEILDKYCSWLFPILFRIEEINNAGGIKKPNRYIGYIGETLETLYFMYNKDNVSIAHTTCRFLI